MANILFFAFLILPGVAMIAVWNDFSITETIRKRIPSLGSLASVKLVLITVLIIYGLVLVGFLVKNSGSKRTISIESRTEHGVVVIKKVKYPTYYVSQQARIIYHIDNPIDYLFLNTDVLRQCYVDGLLRLAITILIIIFLWRFNFDEPFQWVYYNRAGLIFWLTGITLVLEIMTNLYTSTWVRDTLNDSNTNGPRYQYVDSYYSTGSVYLFAIIISSLFYMYRQAIRNREEIDLTI